MVVIEELKQKVKAKAASGEANQEQVVLPKGGLGFEAFAHCWAGPNIGFSPAYEYWAGLTTGLNF